jgi:triosephosphate isomerase
MHNYGSVYLSRYLIAANWKMNGSPALVREMALALSLMKQASLDLSIFPPFPFLSDAVKAFAGVASVGAQHVSEYHEGAFTGEISGSMLKAIGVTAALVGHSERRQLYGETDALAGQRLVNLAKQNIHPILCVGETLVQREEAKVESVILNQLSALDALSDGNECQTQLTIAYEPVWAIGTGQQASPDQANEVHEFIRRCIRKSYPSFERGLRVLYGGSVKADNVRPFLQQPSVDGVLVGGASLSVDGFLALCTEALLVD